MRLPGVLLLLLLTCQLATPTPIFDRDGRGSHGRSAGFGESIRDWFKVLKDRIVGKWKEWFGDDGPTPSLSPQDFLNIDKSIGGRIPGYPGLFIDLFTESDYDGDSDDWDMRPLLPGLPSLPPIFGNGWTPDFRKFGPPPTTQSPTTTPRIEPTTARRQTTQTVATTQSPTTTPRIEPTTSRQQTIQTTTQSASTPTEPVATTVGATTATFTDSTPLTTQMTTTSDVVEPSAMSSEEVLTSRESVVTNSGPVVPNESTLATFTESTVIPVESTSSTEPTLTSETIETSIESTVITTEAIVTSTDELTTNTATNIESLESNELDLPSFNKRVEENETFERRTTKKPRPASAEVIMF
ncbi:PREDICTED: salivary glue protein Sgs-3-like isoform X3 [Vollenhovia emeryi]|uniref:salivary glue protein Sgs-3-like isoform X3 n=1 Tax=Vollenhovia emeryi TaxID=411798 RepID=UPI0005F5184B|nr:PREDICTED: salivary glue protein Sgs-3-like isoform X3 [Vollenhovia emeryi]